MVIWVYRIDSINVFSGNLVLFCLFSVLFLHLFTVRRIAWQIVRKMSTSVQYMDKITKTALPYDIVVLVVYEITLKAPFICLI